MSRQSHAREQKEPQARVPGVPLAPEMAPRAPFEAVLQTDTKNPTTRDRWGGFQRIYVGLKKNGTQPPHHLSHRSTSDNKGAGRQSGLPGYPAREIDAVREGLVLRIPLLPGGSAEGTLQERIEWRCRCYFATHHGTEREWSCMASGKRTQIDEAAGPTLQPTG